MSKFLVLLFLLVSCFVFVKQSFAAAPLYPLQPHASPTPTIPSEKQNTKIVQTGSQIIVSFRKNQSPKELQSAIDLRNKEISKDIFSAISIWTKQFTGQVPGLSYYITKLQNIQTAQKEAHVISSKFSYSYKNGNTVYEMTIRTGEDPGKAVERLQKLPEVEYASRKVIMYPLGSQKIQSLDTSNILDRQIYVEFKDGFTPDQIAESADKQLKIQSLPLGTLRVAADSLMGSSKTDYNSILNSYAKTRQETKTVETSDLLPFEPKHKTPLQNSQIVAIQEGESIDDAIKKYQALPQVKYVQKRPIAYPRSVPNDTLYNRLWGMQKIQAETAWNTSTGSNSVTVAVVDSGIDPTHPDLSSEIIKGPNYYTGGDPIDDVGHGTHVSGTIGAIGNNGQGVAGINWNIRLLEIKVFGAQGGDPNPGIMYAVDHGAKVINLSIGGCTDGVMYQDQHCNVNDINKNVDLETHHSLDYALNAGVTVVIAAGNGNQDSIYENPANYNNSPGTVGKVIVVGASGPDDERAAYSNFGSMVDIAAPGGDAISGLHGCSQSEPWHCLIYSTFPVGLSSNEFFLDSANSGYASAAGTSMATPHVAGAAALLLSINPNLTPDQIKNTLISTADPISTDKPIGPRLNLAKAVAAVSGGVTSPTNTPTPTPTNSPNSTPSPTPTGAQNSSPTPTFTPTPTPTKGPTPTPTPLPKNLNVSFLLPGIGSGGNTVPTHTQRNFGVEFIGSGGNIIASQKGTANYQGGAFVGTVPIPVFPPGAYQIKIWISGSLSKLVPGFFTLPTETDITTTRVSLTTGDVTTDSSLDILDYNMLLACIQKACIGNTFTFSDLNDDNSVDAKDLNILLRSFASRGGE